MRGAYSISTVESSGTICFDTKHMIFCDFSFSSAATSGCAVSSVMIYSSRKTGKLVNAFIVNTETMAEKDLIVISEKGQVIRLPFKSVNQLGRDTQGVRLMRFKEVSDKVACVTWV